MPADERIKVIFKRVFVKDDADTFGSGEFFFTAKVGNLAVGNPGRIFNAVENRTIDLPSAEWSGVVDVRNLSQVIVSFRAKDQDGFLNGADDDLGGVTHTLRLPFRQQVFQFVHSTRFFSLEWEVQLSVGGRFGRHAPAEVFATRQNTGSVTCTTVSGSRFIARMECHPVRPVPPTGLPVRPAFPAGTVTEQNLDGSTLAADSPINLIPNPSVIPILGAPSTAPPGPHTNAELDAANWANERNCTRIEFTEITPKSLNFSRNDSRLEWTAVPVNSGSVSFFGPARGPKIMVFGTAAGEVRLECRFKGALFATYRALVDNLRRIPCRCNILNGPTADSTPRTTPDDARTHVQMCNRVLRQIGLELTLDTNATRTHGALATTVPGVFRINVSRGRTRRVDGAQGSRAAIMNHRQNVMNFCYIHSDQNPNVGGFANDFPNSTLAAPVGSPAGTRPTITDSGTPSTSWTRPTGVGIGADAATTTLTMTLIAGIPRAGHPNLFSMILTDLSPDASTFARSMAHEIGHILNLGHRVEGTQAPHPTPGVDAPAGTPANQLAFNGVFFDGMNHPPQENVLYWAGMHPRSQDFDIIQARAVRFSPLVVAAPVVPPAVPPPPVPPPPISPPPSTAQSVDYVIVQGDWLSKIAERHDMTWQELYNFDGGTGIANKQRLKSGDPDLIYPGEVIRVPAESGVAV